MWDDDATDTKENEYVPRRILVNCMDPKSNFAESSGCSFPVSGEEKRASANIHYMNTQELTNRGSTVEGG